MGAHGEPSAHTGSEPRRPPREEVAPTARGIGHIVVCLDLSPLSERSLPYASRIAKTFGSSITLLHVMQHDAAAMPATEALDWEIARQEATAHLERLAHQLARELSLDVDSRVEEGHPAERIVALPGELGADLTVLCSHGQGGETESELGSTVQEVLAEVRGSVLICRSHMPEHPGAPRRILVPLDGSTHTEGVLPIVTRIAAARGAEVLLVHVVVEPQPSAVLSNEDDVALARSLASRIEAGARRYLDTLCDRLASQMPSIRTLVVRDVDECESLLRAIAREDVELVVLSAHGSTCNPAHAFGSVASHLLKYAKVPVLVLSDVAAGRAGDVVSGH